MTGQVRVRVGQVRVGSGQVRSGLFQRQVISGSGQGQVMTRKGYDRSCRVRPGKVMIDHMSGQGHAKTKEVKSSQVMRSDKEHNGSEQIGADCVELDLNKVT